MRKQRKRNFEFFRNSSKSLITIIYTFCCSIVFSQPTLDWVKTLGGTSYDYGNAIELDQSGNIYVTGIFGSSTDFDPGPNQFILSPSGAQDIFLLKLDVNGNFQWCVKFGGASPSSSYNDSGHDIAIDQQGNVILTGLFKGVGDFNPEAGVFNLSSNSGQADVFVVKLTSNGNFLWAKSFGGFVMEEITSIDVDLNNNIYLSGNFYGNTDFDPGVGTFFLAPTLPYSNGSYSLSTDIFQLKLNSNGDFVWANMAGDYSTDISFSKVDNQGNIYSTGRYLGSVDFDPSINTSILTTASNVANVFLRKQDTNGNLLWVKGLFGGDGRGNSIAIDQLGNIYISGYFQGTVDFDPSSNNFNLSSSGSTDAFIAKFDNNGNFLWVNQIGSTDGLPEEIISLTVDNTNKVLAIGQSWSTLNNIDFDPGLNTYLLNGNGPFLIKYNENGDFSWATNPVSSSSGNTVYLGQGNGSGGENGGFCLKTNSNGIFLTGGFSQTADFDPSQQTSAVSALGNSSPTDIFIQKLNICTYTSNTISPSACGSYTAPDGQIYTQSGQYNSTLTNATGCDSVITINLTIQQSITSSITENACEEYTAPDGQVYTQSGLYTATIPTAAGCDSIITINLTLQTIDTVVTRIGNTLTAIQNGATYQWINCATNQPINGATSQSYTATSPGWFAVLVTVNGCTEQSSCRQIKKLILPIPPLNGNASIDEEDLLEFRIYPNPIRDVVFIEFTAERTDDYVLMDASGRKVQTGTLNGKTTSISLKDLSTGTYMLQIGADTVPIRLVKE